MESAARRGKALSSTAKQLRGWVGSDPSKEPGFVDALNELTEHRLLTGAAAEGVADAQEAFTRAYRTAPAPGTLGPLTKTDTIVRQVRAMAHLAMVQVAAGQPEAAAATALAALGVRAELGRPELDAALPPAAKVWLLTAVSRGAMASGDRARANAYADAALARTWDESFTQDETLAPLAVATRVLVADQRWVAGVTGDAVAHAREARDLARRSAEAALATANQLAPADVHQAAGPVVGAWRDVADRLGAAGDVAGGLRERRALIAWLEALTGRAKADQRGALAWARADLAQDLLGVGDLAGAVAAATQALDSLPALTRVDAAAALPLHLSAAATLATAALPSGDLERAASALGGALAAYEKAGRPDSAAASYALALAIRADIEDAHELTEDAAATREDFRALAASLLSRLPAGEDLYASVPAAVFVRDLARGVVTRSPLPTPHWENLAPTEALGASFTGGSAEAVIPSTVQPMAAPVSVPKPVREPEPEPTPVEPESEWVEVEPASEPEPGPVTAPESAAVEPETEWVDAQPALEHESVPEPETEPEPAWVEPDADPEPQPEPVTAHEEEPEPVREPEPESAAVEPEPEWVEAEPEREPEPTPADPETDWIDAQPELEHESVPEPETEPEPAWVEPDADPEPQPEPVTAHEEEPEPIREPEPEATAVAPQPEWVEPEPEPQPEPLDPAAHARSLLAEGRAAEAETAARAELQIYRPTGEVVALLRVIADARAAQGDRKGVPAIANQIVEQLRPLAEADLATHGADLVGALQALSEARKAAGDWWGSLGPGREAKQLAKRLGR